VVSEPSESRNRPSQQGEEPPGKGHEKIEPIGLDVPRFEATLQWQRGLLRVLLRTAGIVALVACVLEVALIGRVPPYIAPTAIVGATLLGLSLSRLRNPRGLNTAFVVVVFAVLAYLMASQGWVPGVSVALCLLLVASTLLLGPRAAFWIILSSAVLLAVGGLAANAGLYAPALPSEMSPTRWINWIRVGSVFVALASGAIAILSYAIGALEQAERDGARSVEILQRELRLLDSTRAERIEREIELRGAQKLATVAQLGQGFAHLFNNVITVVRSALEEARSADSERARRAAVAPIARVAQAATARIRDLLLLSRPHNDATQLVELRAAVLALRPKLEAQLREDVDCAIDTDATGYARIPESWLEQAATNLLLNAEQSFAGPGTVILRTGQRTLESEQVMTSGPVHAGTYAILQVLDSGPGFSPQAEIHACEPFFTTRGRDTHDGLGLTVVHGMVRALGGALQVENVAGGAAVSLLLPVASEQPGQQRAGRPAPSSGSGAGALTAAEPGANHAAPSPPEPSVAATDPQRPSRPTPEAVVPSSSPPKGRRVPEWKDATLRHLLGLVHWLFAACAIIGASFLSRGGLVRLILLIGAGGWVVLYSAKRHPRWPYGLRLAALLGCFWITGATFTVALSYLSPVPVIVLFSCITLTTIIVGRLAAALMLGTTLGVFVLGGALHQAGLVTAPLDAMSPAIARNWFRIALMLPLTAWAMSGAVLHVLTWARRRVEQLARTLRELESARKEREAETEALLDTVRMTARAGRMEAAGRLTGTVAHDLNNSLHVILGWAELLAGGGREPPVDTPEALDTIERSTDYAEALIQRLQVGLEVPRPAQSLELQAALERMQGMLAATLSSLGGAETRLRVESQEAAFVAIDEQSLRRLLINLVSNARDAMPHGGTCRITVGRDAGHVSLCVEDDGAGMNRDTREQLFSPFFTTKEERGTGLGLHSVAEIVEQSGGTVTLESELGKGARFRIDWPLAPPPAEVPSASFGHELRAARGRILLVEDDSDVLRALARGLRRAGFEPVTATDGDRAFEIIARAEPLDALCTDAIMPGRPTVEIIQAFSRQFPGKPIVLMSGYLPADIEAGAMDNPSVTFLPKPFTSGRLAEELAQRIA